MARETVIATSDRYPPFFRVLMALHAILVPSGLAVLLITWIGPLEMPWHWVLSPFTLLGILTFPLFAWGVHGEMRAARGGPRHDVPEVAPPPTALLAPRSALEAGEPAFARHPELLAAVCLGLERLGGKTLLGIPVTDPWAVYGALATADASGFLHLQQVAREVREETIRPATDVIARTPTEREIVDMVRALLKEGEFTAACVLLLAVLASESPQRNRWLLELAPPVRRLLEQEYPTLRTAQLPDGSHFRFEDWQREAVRDRERLRRLTRTQHRLRRRLDDARTRMQSLQEQLEASLNANEAERGAGREEGRSEGEGDIQALRDELARVRLGAGRTEGRLQQRIRDLELALQTLEKDAAAMHLALFSDSQDEPEPTEVTPEMMSGLRVLLLGGMDSKLGPIREALAEVGTQLVHANSASGTTLISGVHVVVLWTRFLDHSTASAVKNACRAQGISYLYWNGSSPYALLGLLAREALAPG